MQVAQHRRQRRPFQIVDEAKDKKGVEAANGEQPEMGG
jgi:hypothetical protein